MLHWVGNYYRNRLAKLTKQCVSIPFTYINSPSIRIRRSAGLDILFIKAADGIRTHDLVLTKDALYQLSHSSKHI